MAAGGSLGTTGGAAGCGSDGVANASWTGPRAWTSTPSGRSSAAKAEVVKTAASERAASRYRNGVYISAPLRSGSGQGLLNYTDSKGILARVLGRSPEPKGQPLCQLSPIRGRRGQSAG